MNTKILGNRLMTPLLAVLMVFSMLFAVSTFGPAADVVAGGGVTAISGAADMVIAPIIARVTAPHVPILEIAAVGILVLTVTGRLWSYKSLYPQNAIRQALGFWTSNYGKITRGFSPSNHGSHQGALAGGDCPSGHVPQLSTLISNIS